MPDRAPHRRSLASFAMLIACMLVALPAAAQARPLANTALAVAPGAVALTLPLGASATQTLMLSNLTDTPLAPTLLEAAAAPPASMPAPAPGQPHLALPRQAGPIDPQLSAELGQGDRQADFMVYLREQADLAAAYQIRDWAARGRYVYQQLRDHAERSQRGLRAALDARGLAYRPFWIANAVLVHGNLADAQALVARPDVALLRANHINALPSARAAIDSRCSPDDPANPTCWNIRRIGADRVWNEFGITGHGIVVANIDTGVRFDHPALVAQYRGTLGPARYDHNYNWFDPKALYRVPNDPNGHGTHTLGTMVAAGSAASGLPGVGVAPGARWISAQGCASTSCSEIDLIASAQWMLAPTTLDGRDPRPELRPMIVNNSWSAGGNDDWYAGYTAVWRAAGIFPVFAAGNSGSACGTIGSPGDYPDVLGVGATDMRDLAASFSARGPTADGRRKPDMVAPGGGPGILSTGPGGSGDYRTLQGTSMAAPHAAGLVALLWSANPQLIGDYDATMAILRGSARPLADTSCGDMAGAPNNVYGDGRIDAYAAVQRARVDVPWLRIVGVPEQVPAHGIASVELQLDAAKVPAPGSYQARVQVYSDLAQAPISVAISLTVSSIGVQAVVSGRVVSADTQAPVAATVGVRQGQQVSTGPAGEFALTLAPGVYELTVAAPAFISARYPLTVTHDLQLPDLVLQPGYPQIIVSAPPISAALELGQREQFGIAIANQGPRPLHYQIQIWPDQFAAFRSDEAGGPAYAWVSLPTSAASVDLGSSAFKESIPLGFEFPFYSYTFTDTVVAADGFLAFSPPPVVYSRPVAGCFPDIGFVFYEIAPFRTDIDLTRGGSIRYATIDHGQTFVLSYEHVHLQDDSTGASYSFQVLLHSDGRVVFQYRDLPAPPSLLAVGLQRTPLDFQQLGCGASAPIHAGLAIELRPQPATPGWLTLSATAGEVPVGGQHVVTATLRWVLPRTLPQRGRIEISSDDPIRARVRLPASLMLEPPPYRRWLPAISRPLF